QERHRRRAAGRRRHARAREAGRARSRQEDSHPRHRRGRPAPRRPGNGAALRCRRTGARGGAQAEEAEAEGERMNSLTYGLTPKMKPVSPKRSAAVAAIDIGTSKIACLIARLKPHAPQEVLRRRTHAVDVIGFSHTGAHGMKAGNVVDLVEAE